MSFPNDDTGNVLAEMQAAGVDLSKEYSVVFFQLFEQEQQARLMAEYLAKYHPEIEYCVHADQETANIWDLNCTIKMIPSYDAIVAQEVELEAIAAKFNGYNDGWGIEA
jgi:hypothetical protein